MCHPPYSPYLPPPNPWQQQQQNYIIKNVEFKNIIKKNNTKQQKLQQHKHNCGGGKN